MTGWGRAIPPAPVEPRTNASDSPLIARDVEVGAQRPPDIPWVDAVLDGMHRGSPAETREHMVDEQRPTTHRPELTLDEDVEFRQPHAANLRRRRERFMAHPYRIVDASQGFAGPPRRLPIARRRQHFANRCRQRLRSQRAYQ
jgi:hypothetical protein